ncbi:carotenoid oxygenase family protein [Actinoplanes sp. NPDC049265]|uniref:carotenoid oxygenase family protein n=1 Tax=Actinoplanes sp. NPDC049265 TaxID=3363902 RepID=UPI00371F48E0
MSLHVMDPVPDEINVVDLPVDGVLPPELTGRYFRNGPNPRPGELSRHWFGGAGMIHGVRLNNGRAEWYRNRWVKSDTSTGNTSLRRHAGHLYALMEQAPPVEIDLELDTVGDCTFDGRLTGGMTAHPKDDVETGELHFFGYAAHPPYLTYHRLDAAGNLVQSLPIEVPGPTMMHDFAITRGHIVWLDLPVVFDLELVGKGMPYVWSDTYGARIGVMAKGGGPVRWFDVEPSYVFHVGNASEDAQGRIVLDAVRYDRDGFRELWPVIGRHRELRSVVHRWTLDPATGRAAEQPLDDRPVEFPTLHDGYTGRPNRYLYAVGMNEILKYDAATGAVGSDPLGDDWRAGEAVFVPGAEAAAEDDGWLISITTHTDPGVPSRLLVHDATALSAGPVATVQLPRRVPIGFHGTWIPDPITPSGE